MIPGRPVAPAPSSMHLPPWKRVASKAELLQHSNYLSWFSFAITTYEMTTSKTNYMIHKVAYTMARLGYRVLFVSASYAGGMFGQLAYLKYWANSTPPSHTVPPVLSTSLLVSQPNWPGCRGSNLSPMPIPHPSSTLTVFPANVKGLDHMEYPSSCELSSMSA